MRFVFCSPVAIEPWFWENGETGIGGNEQGVIELSWRLARRGHEVTVYTQTPWENGVRQWRGTSWGHVNNACYADEGVWVLCRCPQEARWLSLVNQKVWLVVQDFEYAWTADYIQRLDLIWMTCQTHFDILAGQHPELRPRMGLTTNGVKIELVKELEPQVGPRNPHKIMFASSPDRGLRNLLKIFARAKEAVPDLELHVFYGFNGIDKIAAMNKGGWPVMEREKALIMELASKTPGVFMRGRVTQRELYQEWLTSGMWLYPTLFREMSPIHGDSLVETLAEPVPIKDLVGKEVNVYSCNADGTLSISVARNAACTRRNAPVIKLTYRPGRGRNAKQEQSLILAPDHEVMLVDGSYVTAGSLKVGDHVKAFRRMPSGWGKGYATVGLTGQNLIPAHRFSAEIKIGRSLAPGEVADHVDGNTKNNNFDNLEVKTQAKHISDHWLRMTEEEREKKKEILALAGASADREPQRLSTLARWQEFYLLSPEEKKKRMAHLSTPERRAALSAISAERGKARWGDSPWWNKDTLYQGYAVEGKSTTELGKQLGTCSSVISAWLRRHGIPARPCGGNHVITDIADAGRADVFCMEVDPDHNFIANGLVVHNCITGREAQCMGAIPILTPTWGQFDSVKHGVFVPGDPEQEMTRARFTGEIIRMAKDLDLQEAIRTEMMAESRVRCDWEVMVDQFEEMARC